MPQFDVFICARVHLNRRAFIHAVSRRAHFQKTNHPEKAKCALPRLSIHAVSQAKCTDAQIKMPNPGFRCVFRARLSTSSEETEGWKEH